MLKQAYAFKLDGEPLLCSPFGNGHINRTFLLVDVTARTYILQKINKNVFRDPEAVMRNVVAVIEHLQKKSTDRRFKETDRRSVVSLVPASDGKYWLEDDQGEFWRLYDFTNDTICLESAENPRDFRESAIAFGRFQQQLSDFDASILAETIPKFHDTPARYEAFHQALDEDVMGRAKNIRREIDFFLAREEYAGTLMGLLAAGDLPLRVTHNDTKLNNVLLDRETRQALCVIDLDTVMPGLVANDFGDAIRFGASTAAEDEPDVDKVQFSFEMYEAFTEGFFTALQDSLTSREVDTLADGAKMMTLECGLRFLTDYLQGDTYFQIHRPEHNLERCRTHVKLLSEMEANWNAMRDIVQKAHDDATK